MTMFAALLLSFVVLNQLLAPFRILPWGLVPDLALLAAVAGGHCYSPGRATLLGFSAGLLQETLAGGLLGVGACSKGLTGLLWAPLWRRAVGDAPLFQVPLLIGVTLVDSALFFCASLLFAAPTSPGEVFLPLLGRQLVANVVLGPVVLWWFASLYHRLTQPRRMGRRRHASAITFQPH
jgi:rod shape-determining protein MreD